MAIDATLAGSRALGLTYCLPEPTKPRTVLRVPGTHTLYVGPTGCMRRHALHELEYGDGRYRSFLHLSEVDLISGDYEEMVGDAVEELLERLRPAPQVVFLNVFCVDSLLGTDEQALHERLGVRFPGHRFVMERIDPVSLDEGLSMAKNKHLNLYSLLEPAAEHDRGVNFLGHFASLEPECELLALLASWGASPIRELFRCQTYQDYQEMAKSRLAIVFRSMAADSALDMEDRLGIPFVHLPPEYGVDRVIRGYEQLAERLGSPIPDFAPQREALLQDVRRTLDLVGDIPVVVDSSAMMSPFAAARALLDYGFNVTGVFRSSHLFDTDKEDAEYLATERPDVQVHRSEDYANLLSPRHDSDCIAIGADCARLLRVRHVVDIWHDEGFYGFHGIHRLLALMREALMTDTEWPEMTMPGKN